MASYNPLSPSTNAKRYVLSTVPCLSAFVSLLVPHVPIQIAIQLAGFIGLYGADLYCHVKTLVPQWYITLRSLLTGVVSLCMGGTLYTVYQREQEPRVTDVEKAVV
jgi:hypothetical protein